MFVLPTKTTCTAANLSLAESAKIFCSPHQYGVLRSSGSETVDSACSGNDGQDGGEEHREGADAAEARQRVADEVEYEDGHCGEEGGEDRAEYVDGCADGAVAVVVQ
jgi:hypothetical protein